MHSVRQQEPNISKSKKATVPKGARTRDLLVSSIADLPNVPAVYAMYGAGRNPRAAYAGIGERLRRRVHQHLVKRDSSVPTGTSVVGLNVEYVRQVAWWEHEEFNDRWWLEAGELVAFEMLAPDLRSRGEIRHFAGDIARSQKFRRQMRKLFDGPPTGRLILPDLPEIALRLASLERRIANLEARDTSE